MSEGPYIVELFGGPLDGEKIDISDAMMGPLAELGRPEEVGRPGDDKNTIHWYFIDHNERRGTYTGTQRWPEDRPKRD